MKKIALIFTFLIIGFIIVSADTWEHESGGISIWFPDNWRVTIDGDALEAEAPTEDAFAQLIMLDVDSLEQAIEDYMNEMDDIMKNFRVTSEGENVEWNGLRVYYVEGKGRIQGVRMETSVALIQGNRGIVMMITFNTKEAGRRNRHIYEKIVRSIRPI